MSLYTPRSFQPASQAAALELLRAHPFGTLITSAADGEPHVSHVPLRYEPDANGGAVVGHLARANPQWQHFTNGHTMAVFHGPHSYVSPNWYEDPSRNVPTWNYAVVHVHGRPQLMGEEESRAHLLQLTRDFEGDRFVPDAARVAEMLRGIVGFRMPVERIDAKFKMSQNKSERDRRGVIAGLRASSLADALATAQWMEAHEPH